MTRTIPPTTTILNRMGSRQLADAELAAYFNGDPGKARLWAIDEAIPRQELGGRQDQLGDQGDVASRGCS